MLAGGDDRLGRTIDNFRLLSVLGTGATSIVYLGQRLEDPRALVAVKVLTYQGAIDPHDVAAFRARFLREARAVSKLRHEHIMPVLSYGDTGEVTYMVLPVIVGGTLATRLASQQEPMPLAEIALYLRQLASALDYAHEQGLVHRDVKPSNILMDEHGRVFLTDFGIARLYDSGANAMTSEGPLTLTRTGQMLGTPYYMAPEQIKGGPVGPATDTYALGVVLYQMVTGRVPFHGDTPLAVAMQHLQETPGSLRLLRDELPAPIDHVVLRALAKDPHERYATASALASAFEQGIGDMPASRQGAGTSAAWSASTRLSFGPLSPEPPSEVYARAMLRSNQTDGSVGNLPADSPYASPSASPAARQGAPSGYGPYAPPAPTYEPASMPPTPAYGAYTSPPYQQSFAPPADAMRTSPPMQPPGPPAPPTTRGNRNKRTAIISAGLLVCLLAATAFWVIARGSPFGGKAQTAPPKVLAAGALAQVAFLDGQNGEGNTDALKINATNLPAPPAGSMYHAWLINSQTERVLPLGMLAQQNGAYILTYGGDGTAGHPGTNLLGYGDKLEITLEQGQVQAPTGRVVLSGAFPPAAFVHIKHLLVAFDTTPGNIGLLVGVIHQGRALYAEVALLQSMIQKQFPISTRCAAQGVIDIIEGAHGANYHPLGNDCAVRNITDAGDGFGLLGNDGYLAGASDHASLAAHSADASAHIREHAGHVVIAAANVTGWLTTVDQDTLQILGSKPDTSKLQEIVTLTDRALHGVDIDGDESIDPVPGEAGIVTAYTHGQLLASLTLAPVKG